MKHEVALITRAFIELYQQIAQKFLPESECVSPKIILAVSGGSDSMGLALAASIARSKVPPECVKAVIIDHGLREESGREARQVADTLRSMGVKSEIIRAHITHGKWGIEAHARKERYLLLESAARTWHAQAIFTAHTCDDQAETMLLGFARGSGARSIQGMAPLGLLPYSQEEKSDDILLARPFLALRKEDIRIALRSEAVSWVEDPSNSPENGWRGKDGKLLRRIAIRHHSLPALEEDVGPGIIEALGRTATLLQADNEALDMWARREYEHIFHEYMPQHVQENEKEVGACQRARVEQLRELPQAVRARVLRLACLEAGARASDFRFAHVEMMDGVICARGSGRDVHMPGVYFMKRKGYVYFVSNPE